MINEKQPQKILEKSVNVAFKKAQKSFKKQKRF